MTVFWLSVVPRLLGAILICFGLWFIPRNWLAVIRADRPWSLTKRLRYVISWSIIVIGYLVSGGILFSCGWTNWLAGYTFAVAMLAFIPIPCHLQIFNRHPFWKTARTIFFILAAITTSWLGHYLSLYF